MITQFHFLAWPDHGVPDESEPLLEMMLSANKLHEESHSKYPIVVHCSAGIGRTGTYVIVSTIVELINYSVLKIIVDNVWQLKQDPKVPPTINLMKSLHQIRGMRSGMVTHKDQYEFCYKTVLAYIQVCCFCLFLTF